MQNPDSMTQKELKKIANVKNVSVFTIDKDWVLGHFLNAMYSIQDVDENFIYKGGTALRKCYFEDYRFSEDLDFTLLNKNYKVDERFIPEIIKIASENSGIKFHFQKQKFQKSDEQKQGYEMKIKYWGADHKPNQKPLPPERWQTQIKLDISFSEKLLTKPEQKGIIHNYYDKEKISQIIPVYSLNEVMSEKMRSLIQRNRPRDIYDIGYLQNYIPKKSYPEIRNLLIEKSNDKGIEIKAVSDFVTEEKYRKNKRAWQSSLGNHLPVGKLSDFDSTYKDVEQFIEKILNA